MDTPAPVYTTEAVPLWGGFCLEAAPMGCKATRGGELEPAARMSVVVRWGRAQGVLAGPMTTEG